MLDYAISCFTKIRSPEKKIIEPVNFTKEPLEKIGEVLSEQPTKDENTVNFTFKSVASLIFFIFLCAILAAALSDKVSNLIAKDGATTAHYFGYSQQ